MSEENSVKRTIRPLDVLIVVTDEDETPIDGAKVSVIVATRDPREYLERYREYAGRPGTVELTIPCTLRKK